MMSVQTTRFDVLTWIRTQALPEDIRSIEAVIDYRTDELTRLEPWTRQIRPGGWVRVKGTPAPRSLHGEIGRVARLTKNPMKVAVDFGGEIVILHAAALESADEEMSARGRSAGLDGEGVRARPSGARVGPRGGASVAGGQGGGAGGIEGGMGNAAR